MATVCVCVCVCLFTSSSHSPGEPLSDAVQVPVIRNTCTRWQEFFLQQVKAHPSFSRQLRRADLTAVKAFLVHSPPIAEIERLVVPPHMEFTRLEPDVDVQCIDTVALVLRSVLRVRCFEKGAYVPTSMDEVVIHPEKPMTWAGLFDFLKNPVVANVTQLQSKVDMTSSCEQKFDSNQSPIRVNASHSFINNHQLPLRWI